MRIKILRFSRFSCSFSPVLLVCFWCVCIVLLCECIALSCECILLLSFGILLSGFYSALTGFLFSFNRDFIRPELCFLCGLYSLFNTLFWYTYNLFCGQYNFLPIPHNSFNPILTVRIVFYVLRLVFFYHSLWVRIKIQLQRFSKSDFLQNFLYVLNTIF